MRGTSRMMITTAVFAGLMLALSMMLAGCTDRTIQRGDGKVRVVASFYPLYDFAKNVGGDRVRVTTLIPMGLEPHEFEPTVSDIVSLSEADVFIYNGAGMEPWAERIVQSANHSGLVVADTSRGITLLKSGSPESAGGAGAGIDPHIWLSPSLAKVQVDNIRDALSEADPEGKAYYEKNAAAYNARLDALDSEIMAAMDNCSKKNILVTHATLGYFCRRYGCTQLAITGVDPEAEPSPADLAKIIDQARENNVTAVFLESMIDPRAAQTISSEINGSVLTFNSVHGLTPEEEAAGDGYISLMEGNLANIKIGLGCE